MSQQVKVYRKLEVGTSASNIALVAGSPIVDMHTTCSSTSASTSAEPFYMKSTMTGAAGVGGRALFHMYTNVALGGWSNAIKGYASYGSAGRTAGLGSAVCGEILLSAGTTSGTYAPLESELEANSAVSTGTSTSFFYANIDGSNSSGKTTINTNGHLFELGAGIVDTANGLLDAITSDSTPVFEYRLRIMTGAGAMYIPASTSATFAG